MGQPKYGKIVENYILRLPLNKKIFSTRTFTFNPLEPSAHKSAGSAKISILK